MRVHTYKRYWCKCGNAIHPHKKIKRKDLHGKGKLATIKVKNIDFCCLEMEEAYNEDFIHFGEYDDEGMNYDKNINIIKCNPWPEGTCWWEFAIKFCPFCKEEIKILGEK